MPYNKAYIVHKTPPGVDQRIHLVVEFREEPFVNLDPIRFDRYTDGSLPAVEEELNTRIWARAIRARLNDRKSIYDRITIPFEIDLSPPPAPAGPSNKEIWQAKMRALSTATEANIPSGAPTALFDAIATLRDNVRTTYAAGFLDGL